MIRRGRPRKQSKKIRVPHDKYEESLRRDGYQLIAGVDEVGRGAWAGPLYAAAVILPKKRIYKIRDSKLLTAKEREELDTKIREEAIDFGYGRVEVEELVENGMHQGTLLAFKRALSNLKKIEYVLTDRFHLQYLDKPYQNITGGDQVCLSVAAASIIAKVKRDNIMTKLASKYPHYDFASNKGYISPNHRTGLKKYGPSEVHRPNFKPIRDMLKARKQG
jgi:ribonuclease HII